MAAPAGNRSAKGNPAHKRMTNAARKAKRERSWRRGQERKAARIKEQEARRKANNELRAAGLPTPYEEAQAMRRAAHEARKR